MSKRTDKDGLYHRDDSPFWWASYIDRSGKRTRRSTGITDRKEAEALLAKWRLESHRAQHWNEQQLHSFEDLMVGYLKATAEEKRSHERDLYSTKHLNRFFAGKVLESLRGKDIRGYTDMRRDEGISNSTINRELGLLSSAINYARREWEWEIPNPVQGRKPKEPEGRIRWAKREEIEALIREAGRDPRATHLPDLIRLACHTGMRKGEMLGLEWSRVDFSRGLIHLEAKHTKTARRRSIPINAEARQALISRIRFRAEYCPASPWVFCNRKGERIGCIKHSFTNACRKLGLEDFRVHDLRHTCAAWLVTAGVPMAEIAALLGHASITMTERYAHLEPANVRVAVDKLASQVTFKSR